MHRVGLGMTYAQVRALMGDPDRKARVPNPDDWWGFVTGRGDLSITFREGVAKRIGASQIDSVGRVLFTKGTPVSYAELTGVLGPPSQVGAGWDSPLSIHLMFLHLGLKIRVDMADTLLERQPGVEADSETVRRYMSDRRFPIVELELNQEFIRH